MEMDNKQLMEAERGRTTSIRMEQIDDLELWQLGSDRMEEFNRFIYKIYSEAFRENEAIPFTFQEIASASQEYFHRTKLCAVYHKDGDLLGTWGLVLKDLQREDFLLPIESRFGISAKRILEIAKAKGIHYMFNGWRTAIDKKALERVGLPGSKSIYIFDFLLRGLTSDFGEESSRYLGVAEMEMLVLKYHRRVGLPWIILGEPLHFWGRDRYPCAFNLGEFETYLKTHHPERHRFLYQK